MVGVAFLWGDEQKEIAKRIVMVLVASMNMNDEHTVDKGPVLLHRFTINIALSS